MEFLPYEPPNVELIRERHARLLERLRWAAEAGGHDPDRVRVVGVTKTHPASLARAALTAGITRLGESRVQEAEPKIDAVPEAEWHFIGRLQSNKARRAVRRFAVIHALDSLQLLQRVDDLAAAEGTAPRVLLQVNVSGEASKAGMPPSALASVMVPRAAQLVGLMTIAPMGASDSEARAVFARLGQLRDGLEQRIGQALPELSMGMSADAEAAAGQGATLVRIGTRLFGPRA